MLNGYRASVWNDERFLEMDGGSSTLYNKVLNVTELYTLKQLKWEFLYFMYFTIIKI
jgi:hypothetical protein